MRKSWLYFAIRSERDMEPVLIWVAVVPTAMSAMVASSVSPERCDITAAYLAFAAMSTAASVSVSVPIWFGLMRMAFAIFLAIPSLKILVLVTNRPPPIALSDPASGSVWPSPPNRPRSSHPRR
jgi:hypothetical protein